MYPQSLGQAGKGCRARDCWCWRAVGLWHAGWLPGRVLGPAGDFSPSPRGAQCQNSRYGKCVQECCFCLEPLSRSDGAPGL